MPGETPAVAAPAAAPAPAPAAPAAAPAAVAPAPPETVSPAGSAAPGSGTDAVSPAADATPKTPLDAKPADPEPEVEEKPEPPAFPGADEFAWDDWDGKAESLPEPVRAWAEKIAARVQSLADEGTRAAREEAERLAAIWQSLIDGRPDPRMAELQKELDDLKGKGTTYEQQLAEARAAHESTVKEFEAWQDREADRIANDFKSKNEWMFDGGPVEKLANDLIVTEGFGLEELPALLRMPQKLLDATLAQHRELKARGMTTGAGATAIQLARASFKFVPDTDTSAVVDGGEGRISARAAPDAPVDSSDLGQHTLRVVSQNLKSARR